MFANYYLQTNHLASQICPEKQQIDSNVMGHVVLLEQDYTSVVDSHILQRYLQETTFRNIIWTWLNASSLS